MKDEGGNKGRGGERGVDGGRRRGELGGEGEKERGMGGMGLAMGRKVRGEGRGGC